MEELPTEWVGIFERRLNQAKVPQPVQPAYHKWVRFYLRFCQRFGYPATAPTALGPFLTKLAEKNYSIEERRHAATAVRLLLRYYPQDQSLYLQLSAPAAALAPTAINAQNDAILKGQRTERPNSTGEESTSWEREYRELETEIRLRNYSPKTFDTYHFWVSRFQAFVRSPVWGDIFVVPAPPPSVPSPVKGRHRLHFSHRLKNISFVVTNLELAQEFDVFFPKCLASMVPLLVLDVAND